MSYLGSQRGKFVESISGKNLVYQPSVDTSIMTDIEKTKFQSAMRQRRKRALDKQALANINR